MTHYNWDEALGAEGLLALTEEAVTPPRRGRVSLRRLAALAACVGLVLGLVNYQALAAGAERVFHYFLGVGVAEQEASLMIQGEALSMENRENLFLIEGAYQRDGVLTVPLDVLSRSETPDRVWDRQKFRIVMYGADGEKLTGVTRTSEGELVEISNGGRVETFCPVGDERAYYPQGYASVGSVIALFELPPGAVGPFTFEVEAYSSGDGWGEVLWSDTLSLELPRAVDVTQVSREIGIGTVTALVGADRRGVAFYAALDFQCTEAGGRLCQLVVPEVWFIDEAGNRYQSSMRRYTLAEDYLPELRLVEQPEGEIIAIEVNRVMYNISYGDGQGQSYPVYDNLNWIIELP